MTKRNYQMIKMAEQQMANVHQMAEEQLKQQGEEREGNDEKTKELVAQLIENEKRELDEAIKQSLAEEDKRKRMEVIEEEELKRAIQQSLITQDENQQQKKEEPKIEAPKKEEPKKIIPNIISSNINIQYEGKVKPVEEVKPNQEVKPEKKQEENIKPEGQKFYLESSNTFSIESSVQNPYANLESIKKSNLV